LPDGHHILLRYHKKVDHSTNTKVKAAMHRTHAFLIKKAFLQQDTTSCFIRRAAAGPFH